MLDTHSPERKPIISRITQPADSGALTLQHQQSLSELNYLRSQLQRTEHANALRLELLQSQHQRSIEELERNHCLEITLLKQIRNTQALRSHAPGDSKHTTDELVQKHRAEVESLKREFEKRLVERDVNSGKEIGRQHRAEIETIQRQCDVRVTESVQRATKTAAKKEAELLKSAEERQEKQVAELEGRLRMRELDFDLVLKEKQELEERLRKRNLSDYLACQERAELMKKMETSIEVARAKEERLEKTLMMKDLDLNLVMLERDGLAKKLAAARMREKEMVKMRRCIATIKGENRTLWKDVKVLEVLRGISQHDIKLATNAVYNCANSQADASDSSMTDALDYSNSESSFSAFSGASGEVTPDTSMSTHKRTRSDSEDSIMSSRSSSLLKRIKLDQYHNLPLRIDPSEPRLTPQEKPAPTTASPTSSPCSSGAFERLDRLSTNLVLDACDRATSTPIILHAVTPYFQGGCGLIITRPGVFANTPIHREMRKAVEADQYKFVISFSKATQEPSPPFPNTSATDCPTFPLSPYGSGALQHHILNFCDTLAAAQDATPSFLHRLVSSSFAQSSLSDGFKDMFPIMIYRDHHTGTVVSRFFTFSATDNSITGTDNSAPIQDGPTERICSESGTGALTWTVDGEDLKTASDSGSEMDLGSDADMDSRKVGLKSEDPLLSGVLATPLVPLYESESSGSEGSVVAVGIMETLRQIRHKH